jgi:Membrane proteins related to metalloendopeptidases
MRLSVGDTARSAGTDSTLPALRLHDSLATPADSGTIHLYPGAPQRGGVIVAVVPATGSGAPTCTWKAATLPCSRTRGAIRAIIPLPADEPAGEFVLGISSPGVSVRRTIAVADRDFGRQVVLLDSALYALVRHGAEIARDARAVRQVLVGESEAARWSEGWLNPAGKRKATGYGVERLYVPASDSSRVMNLDSAHSTGSFGSDTTMLKTGATPSWRHAGVDIPLPRGSAARAAATGVVVDAAQYVLTGRTVILDHGQGIHTAYFHLDTITVHRGDIVRRGDRVGRVGSTGLATGPHLHYGVYVHGKDVDPAAWHALPAAALAP